MSNKVNIRGASTSGTTSRKAGLAALVALSCLSYPSDVSRAAADVWPTYSGNLEVSTPAGVLTFGTNIYLKDIIQGINSKIEMTIRIDLSTLRNRIVDLLPVSGENCRSIGSNNLVIRYENPALTVDSGKLKLEAKGRTTNWACIENPIPNSKVEWEIKDLGLGVKTKIPVLTKSPGSPIKTIVAEQPFALSALYDFHPTGDGSAARFENFVDFQALNSNVPQGTPDQIKLSASNITAILQRMSSIGNFSGILPPDLRLAGFSIAAGSFFVVNERLTAELGFSVSLPVADADLLKHKLSTLDRSRPN